MSRITDLAELLVKVSPETLDKITEYEAQGRYNEHLDSLDGAVFTPVDGSYEYLPKTHQFKRFLQKQFIVKPFMKYANKLFKTQNELIINIFKKRRLKKKHGSSCVIYCKSLSLIKLKSMTTAISKGLLLLVLWL